MKRRHPADPRDGTGIRAPSNGRKPIPLDEDLEEATASELAAIIQAEARDLRRACQARDAAFRSLNNLQVDTLQELRQCTPPPKDGKEGDP